jgi:hypothetical protein
MGWILLLFSWDQMPAIEMSFVLGSILVGCKRVQWHRFGPVL